MSGSRPVPAQASSPGVEQRLLEALPGLIVLDRNLEFEVGEPGPADLPGPAVTRIDLVAADPLGHLVLALTVECDGDGAVLAVLDALAFARRNTGLFPRLFDAPRLRADLPPKVVLVAPRLSECTRDRLAPLLGRHVELFECRTLRSSQGERTFLVRVGEGPTASLAEHFGTDLFLAQLTSDRRETAQLLLARMGRMDDELRLEIEGNRLAWSMGTDVVARLECADGDLLASIPPDNRVRRMIEDEDVEGFVEDAMVRYAELLDFGPEEDGDELPARDVFPAASVGLLTPEEIEAFRD